MKYYLACIIIALMTITGCTSNKEEGSANIYNNYDFIVLDEQKSSGEKTVKLSELVEDYEVVKFENSDSALFKALKPIVSDNYIVILQDAMNPVMLFNRSGKFLCNVGSNGQGPGEYRMPYDAVIDEKKGSIYIAQFNSKPILEYDLEGKFLGDYDIKNLNKPVLFLDNDGNISAVTLGFNDMDDPITAATYRQKEGELETLQYTPLLGNFRDNSGYGVGFNNEIWAFKNFPNNTFMITLNDTLYTYDSKNNSVKPRAFLVEDGGKDNETWYVATELSTAILYQVMGPNRRLVWYDKNTGEMSHAKLINDLCGNATFSSSNFRNGYFIQIWEPGLLKDRIENRWLPENEMSESQREDMEKLAGELDVEGNNVMFIGQLKTE